MTREGDDDKNLCRCFGAPVRRVFPDHLITSEFFLTYFTYLKNLCRCFGARFAGFSLIT